MKVWVERFYPIPNEVRVFSSKENVEAYWNEVMRRRIVDILPVPPTEEARHSAADKRKITYKTDESGRIVQMRFGEYECQPLCIADEVEVDEWFIDKAKENNNGTN